MTTKDINKNNMKSYRLYIFILIAAIVLLYTFFSRNSDFVGSSYTRQDFLKDVERHRIDYLDIGNLLRKELDTAFFAEYRLKQNQFYFYYLNKENKLNNFFDSSGSIDHKLFKAKELKIKEIKKNNNENFFRLFMVKNENMKPKF